MKFYPFLSLFIIIAIILTGCNSSRNVVSSSFIQKKKYTKGYHFDLSSNHQKQIKSIADNHQSSTTRIKSIERKKIVLVDDYQITDKIKSLPGDNLFASVDDGTIILSTKKRNISVDDYTIIQQKEKQDAQQDYRITNENARRGFILSIVGLIMPVCAIVGLIFSIAGKNEIDNDPLKYKNDGYAYAGIIISIIGIVGWLYLFIEFIIPFFAWLSM